MQKITDEMIVERIEDLLAMSGLKLNQLAEDIDIPYRTLQNQINGTSKMSALTLLKILQIVGVSSDHITKNNASLNATALVLALQKVFGDFLPTMGINEDGEYAIEMNPDPTKFTRDDITRNAVWLAKLIDTNYQEEELRLVLFGRSNRST